MAEEQPAKVQAGAVEFVEEQGKTGQISIEHAESYLYSNVAGISISPMDFRIDFADVGVDGASKTVVGITLSPEHAAGLMMLLRQQLANFQKQFGPIRNLVIKPKPPAQTPAITAKDDAPKT